MIRIITCTRKNAKNAGPKAKEDIVKILKSEYGNSLTVRTIYEDDSANIAKRLLRLIIKIISIVRETANRDKIIIQYPMSEKFELLSIFPKKRTIVVIHDLMGLRFDNPKKNKREMRQFRKFSYIIAHNSDMKKYLIENGICETNIYTIDMFDYLVSNKNRRSSEKNIGDIAYAGNLCRMKTPFLYQIDDVKMNFNIFLYGVGIERDINNKIKYIGSFGPDELPQRINCKLGLVWDGNYDESDENASYKNYTKYNNPHKLSCYIAAGIPVIVWSKSAVAKFVIDNNIGYTINNIYDINRIDYSDYGVKKKNAEAIGEKILSGNYTKGVFNSILREKK